MFLWTFLSISIYLLQFNNYLNGPEINSIIPDVNGSLVFLMGLSWVSRIQISSKKTSLFSIRKFNP